MLQALVAKGEAWLRQTVAVLGGARPPLKRLRDLLHAGLRLPVEMPEVEELRGVIRRLGSSSSSLPDGQMPRLVPCVCGVRCWEPKAGRGGAPAAGQGWPFCGVQDCRRCRDQLPRRREWEDAARRAVGAKQQSLGVLQVRPGVGVGRWGQMHWVCRSAAQGGSAAEWRAPAACRLPLQHTRRAPDATTCCLV